MERYNKIKTIGKGTFGSVNLVERIADGKRLAIKKIYLGEACPNPKNETQILETLHHPNIITYYESFIYNNKFYIVTDYAAHGTIFFHFHFFFFIFVIFFNWIGDLS